MTNIAQAVRDSSNSRTLTQPTEGSLPNTNLRSRDSEVKLGVVERDGKKALSIECEGAKVGLRYERTDNCGRRATGTFPPLGKNTSSASNDVLTLSRQGDGVSIVIPGDVGKVTAIVTKKDGTVVEVDVLKELNGAAEKGGVEASDKGSAPQLSDISTKTEPATKPEPGRVDEASDIPIPERNPSRENRPDSNGREDTVPKRAIMFPEDSTPSSPSSPSDMAIAPSTSVGRRITLPPVNTYDALKEENKQIVAEGKEGYPDEVLSAAGKLGIENLKDVKIEGPNYIVCVGDTCHVLGKVEAKSPALDERAPKIIVERATTSEPEEKSATPESRETKKDQALDFSKLPAGSTLAYSYRSAQGMSSGSLVVPAIGSRTSAISQPGVGKFSRNADGTFRFEADPSFSGTLQMGEVKEKFEGADIDPGTLGAQRERSTSPENNQPVRDALRRVAEATRNTAANLFEPNSNVTHVSAQRAMDYVKAHPHEKIVVIITSPRICGPCRTYDALLPDITRRTPEAKFLIVDTGPEYSAPIFGVSCIPQTIVYQEGRSNPIASSAIISGVTNQEAIKAALSR